MRILCAHFKETPWGFSEIMSYKLHVILGGFLSTTHNMVNSTNFSFWIRVFRKNFVKPLSTGSFPYQGNLPTKGPIDVKRGRVGRGRVWVGQKDSRGFSYTRLFRYLLPLYNFLLTGTGKERCRLNRISSDLPVGLTLWPITVKVHFPLKKKFFVLIERVIDFPSVPWTNLDLRLFGWHSTVKPLYL